MQHWPLRPHAAARAFATTHGICPSRIALRARLGVPETGEIQIHFLAAAAVFVITAQHILRRHVAALSRCPIPPERLHIVLRRTAPGEILIGQRQFSQHVALLGRQQIPAMRFSRIERHFLPVVEETAIRILRVGHARHRGLFQPDNRGIEIFRAAFAIEQHHGVIKFGEPIAAMRLRHEFGAGHGEIARVVIGHRLLRRAAGFGYCGSRRSMRRCHNAQGNQHD